jgi:two-component system nitrogen regulation response regulator GlnG/two-component system response regulator HydG
VLAWSLDEPERVGESALLPPGVSVLGRGDRAPDERVPRLALHRARPGALERRPPLTARTISRRQLQVSFDAGTVTVTPIGQCPIRLAGVQLTGPTVLRPGQGLVLENQLILVLAPWDPDADPVETAPFPFGRADENGLVGESAAMWELRRTLRFVAQSPGHVLVHGPTGTGKELCARAIHDLSAARRGPFVSRSAATLPQGLVDAELFGNLRNFPNPPMPERTGLVGSAHGGTLFLDEIGETPHEMQAHLLRVLDADGEYHRLGEATPRRSDFRLIAATNRDTAVLKGDLLGRFRHHVRVPPLDERIEDVPLLVAALLDHARRESPRWERFGSMRDGAWVPRLEPKLIEALLEGAHPTNVRGLDRRLWEAMSSSPGDFVVAPPATPTEGPATARPDDLDEAAVREALERAGGNVADAARALGLKNRQVLHRIVRKLDGT